MSSLLQTTYTWIGTIPEHIRQVLILHEVLNMPQFVMNNYEVLLFDSCAHFYPFIIHQIDKLNDNF